MFAKRCFSCALVTNGRHNASAMKYDLEILFILNFSWRDGAVGRRSRTALGDRISALLLALPAEFHAAKRADDTDEGTAIGARIAFGGALLVPAGPAYHRIAFTENLAHLLVSLAVRISEDRTRALTLETSASAERVTLGALNLYQGPHFTTRLAACNHVDNRSGPASCQPSGTGASRFFSPSLSKHSQPWLNSLATDTLR
jgi:hypothetical protein